MIKFTILLARRKDMSHEAFVSYHKDKHAPLFTSLSEVKKYVRRYVQGHGLSTTLPGIPPPVYDGTTELWFDTTEDIGKVFNSKAYMEIIRPDEEKFLDLHGCGFLVITENDVI